MGFCVKIKTKQGQFIVKDLTDATKIGELKGEIVRLTAIANEHLHILIGFPPRPIDVSAETEPISTVGIKSGETLIIEQKLAPRPPFQPSLEDDEALARSLQAEEEAANSAAAAAAAATGAGGGVAVGGGGGNIVSDASGRHSPLLRQPYEQATMAARLPVGQHDGILMKRVVAADNSCLFTSIRYVVKGGRVDNEGSELMRHIIAQTVSADPLLYNDAFLGKSNSDYCMWIQRADSWGGAIEVSILSNYYGIEIDVVDIQNAIINRFGEDKNYPLRVFLLFDGIHYDPLYMESGRVSGPITIFPVAEMAVFRMAEQLAKEAKASRQFTDVDKFTIRCMQCDRMMVGQLQAQEHATETGHTRFGEI